MNAERRRALEAKGYRVYDHAGDAVGMNEEEKELMDIRITLSRAVRKRREKLQLSQKELATRLKITQARVSKIEWGDRDVSLDQIFSAYVAMDGYVATKELAPHAGNGVDGGPKPRKKKARATA
jgi:predicted XRE-type DNA-binding protein